MKYIRDEKFIDGREMACDLNDITHIQANLFRKKYGISPTYVVIMVGDNEASERYVRNKKRTSEMYGIECEVNLQPETITQDELIRLISGYNMNDSVHGIIVQLPLPDHIDPHVIASTINPEKDIDGLNPLNVGKLNSGLDTTGRTPCTPNGIVYMLESIGQDLTDKNVTIIGRSNIVGRPLRALLEQKNANVTTLHSKTEYGNIVNFTFTSDIIISATGVPGHLDSMETGSDQILIDVGTIVVDGKLKGDFNTTDENLIKNCKYITPVPGGVGPMTIAMLLKNVVDNAYRLKQK